MESKTWYDKTARKKVTSYVNNQNVFIQNSNKTWAPGKIIAKAHTPRSYFYVHNKSNKIRRNVHHLRPRKDNHNNYYNNCCIEEPLYQNNHNNDNKNFVTGESEINEDNQERVRVIPEPSTKPQRQT